ncbi:MAG: rhodanese-like domain-containing protein [Clostridia bacterium]|nr:rhodanese-like domain-containing protein [Clostridia bacterium]
MKERLIIIAAAISLAVLLSACGDNTENTTEKEIGAASTEVNDDMINQEQKNAYRQISMDEAVTMMAQESDYIILDVRRPDEFAEKHIPNAINIANETIGTAEIPELPDKDQLIMVYCRSGRRSKEASEKLVKLGYTNIVEFGGILDWTGDVVGGQ